MQSKMAGRSQPPTPEELYRRRAEPSHEESTGKPGLTQAIQNRLLGFASRFFIEGRREEQGDIDGLQLAQNLPEAVGHMSSLRELKFILLP